MGKENQTSGQEGNRDHAYRPHVPGGWRKFNKWVTQTPGAARIEGLLTGNWPEGTPQVFIDLYTKTTVEERLLGSIFDEYPSVEEVQARPADYVRKMGEKRNQERKGRLAAQLGEPIETTASLEELEAKHTQVFGTLKDQITAVLDSLNVRERRVLQGRFGLADGHVRTQRELGEELECSPRTIGRIERRALDKLRHPS